MTWSIVARDADGAFGVAVASRFFAVGALCPNARSGIGAGPGLEEELPAAGAAATYRAAVHCLVGFDERVHREPAGGEQLDGIDADLMARLGLV